MGPKELRELARSGKNFTTSGLAKGHVQTNVVIIPKSYATILPDESTFILP